MHSHKHALAMVCVSDRRKNHHHSDFQIFMRTLKRSDHSCPKRDKNWGKEERRYRQHAEKLTLSNSVITTMFREEYSHLVSENELCMEHTAIENREKDLIYKILC